MMKKLFVFASLVGLVALAFGIGDLAFAQSETPPPFPDPGYGYGRMGGREGYGGMRSGLSDGETGPYHEAMLETFADELGLTVEQIQNRLEAGETMWQIAESIGISAEEFGDIMQQARTKKLEQAVEEGTLTQEQADAMGSRMQGRGFGLGYGDCHGYGVQDGFHRGPHGGWNSP
jgi:hypothetical protein